LIKSGKILKIKAKWIGRPPENLTENENQRVNDGKMEKRRVMSKEFFIK
jgi:hypothetical protein